MKGGRVSEVAVVPGANPFKTVDVIRHSREGRGTGGVEEPVVCTPGFLATTPCVNDVLVWFWVAFTPRANPPVERRRRASPARLEREIWGLCKGQEATDSERFLNFFGFLLTADHPHL
jgi:hypothetical protein